MNKKKPNNIIMHLDGTSIIDEYKIEYKILFENEKQQILNVLLCRPLYIQ